MLEPEIRESYDRTITGWLTIAAWRLAHAGTPKNYRNALHSRKGGNDDENFDFLQMPMCNAVCFSDSLQT